jgi:adenylate cyclase
MNDFWQVRVYNRQQFLHAVELAGPVELGRQAQGEEGPFACNMEAGRSRLVIARSSYSGISRAHVLLTPLPGGRARIDNKSHSRPLFLDGHGELRPRTGTEAALPLVLSIDQLAVRVEQVSRSAAVEVPLQTLPVVTPRLQPDGSLANQFSTLAASPSGHVDAREIVRWLQATMGVFLSAASSSDFFDRAARALVEVVGLDCGAVLLRGGHGWRPEVVSRAPHFTQGLEWEASSSVLDRLCEEKRTFWRAPPPSESTAGVLRVVAAPILDRQGEVIGVLYGDQRIGTRSVVMIGELQASLVELIACGVAAGLARLEKEQAALAAQVKFEQFFTPELARYLAEQPDMLTGRDCEVTVLFCDIRGFSRISERLGPERTVAWIGDVMEALSACVLAERGVVVDYIGDELIAMWGAPEQGQPHAQQACRAALAMVAALPELNRRWQEVLGESMELGIGINTGMARVGNTGSKRKFKYGPLGNTVNLASRVQGSTKYLKCPLLITEATRGHLGDGFALRRLGKVRVVNIQEAVELYELALPDRPGWLEAKSKYEQALAAFEQQDFRLAAAIVGTHRLQQPDDGPALLLLSRAVDNMIYHHSPFDPVWVLPGK